ESYGALEIDVVEDGDIDAALSSFWGVFRRACAVARGIHTDRLSLPPVHAAPFLQISREDFVVKNVVSSAIAFPRRRVRSWSAQMLVVFTKDLMIERATGEIVLTTGFFGVLVAILASLAVSSGPEQKEELAPAVLWLSVTFAVVLGLGRT